MISECQVLNKSYVSDYAPSLVILAVSSNQDTHIYNNAIHSVNFSHRPLSHKALEPQALEPQSPRATGPTASGRASVMVVVLFAFFSFDFLLFSLISGLLTQ